MVDSRVEESPKRVSDAQSVLVIGAGTMGSGIAQTFAAASWRVVLVDAIPDALSAGLGRIETAWQRDVEKGRSDETERSRRQSRIQGAGNYASDAGEVDLIVEAIIEDLAAKTALFNNLSGLVGPDCILASNTSSISITALASATTCPDRVAGLHFFNPAPLMPLVEVVQGNMTTAETTSRCQKIVQGLGKTPVVVRDSPGFVGNRILLPMINEAVKCLEGGVASASDIDAVMKLGMKHPIGPLALADLIGLDVCVHILDVLRHDLNDEAYRAAGLLSQLVAKGRLGRKNGRGFFDYE